MEKLPIELRRSVLQFCDLQSIKSIRVTCKSWAMLGEEYLIPPTFTLLLHRDDISRLHNISQHPTLNSYIQTLELHLGEMNDYQARHNVYFLHYTHEPEVRQKLLEDAWEEYGELQKRKALLATHLFPNELTKSFSHLPNLRNLSIEFDQCPYGNDVLRRLWRMRTSRQMTRRHDIENVYKILIAARYLRLLSFSHDKFPLNFVRYSDESLQLSWSSLESLTYLQLRIDCMVIAHEDIEPLLVKFGALVTKCPNLNTLDLDRHISSNKIEIASHFGGFTWRNLHTLSLPDAGDPFKSTIPFLLRHKQTLRRLNLGAPDSSWQMDVLRPADFCMTLNANLRLEKFQLNGDTIHTTPLEYRVKLLPIYDTNWQRIHQNALLSNQMSSEIFETLIVKGGPSMTNEEFYAQHYPDQWTEEVLIEESLGEVDLEDGEL